MIFSYSSRGAYTTFYDKDNTIAAEGDVPDITDSQIYQ